MGVLPTAKVKQFVTLHREQRRIEAELKRVKEEAAALETELVDAFTAVGVQNIVVDGATVFLARQLWASTAAGQAEALAATMKRLGLGDLVKETVNPSQLSAYVRELPRDANDMPVLPAELTGLVSVRDVVSVRVNERS